LLYVDASQGLFDEELKIIVGYNGNRRDKWLIRFAYRSG